MNILKHYPRYKFILAFYDFCALALSFFIGLKIRFWPHIDLLKNPDYLIHPRYWTLLLYSVICIFVFQYYNLYKKHIFIGIVQQQILIFKAVSISILGLICISFLAKYPKYVIDSRLTIGYSFILCLVLVSFFRIIIFRNLFIFFAKKELIRQRILIVGAGQSGKMVAANILTDKRFGLELVGFVDDNIEVGRKIFQSYIILGDTNELKDIVKMYAVDEIVVCLSNVSHEKIITIIEKCKLTNKYVKVYSDLYEIISRKINVEYYSDFPMVLVGKFSNKNINYAIKRLIDISGSLFGLLLFSPLFLIIYIAIKLDSKGPVIFRQERLGKDGKPFSFYKFRSMYTDADNTVHKEYLKQLISKGKKASTGGKDGVYKILDDPRITRVGKLLRKTSMDELPQLFNVLKGDMSLVGPRPCLLYEYDEYDLWHKRRLKATPGITGLWQVSGRSAVNFDDMVIMDLYYIDHISPWFDAQILIKTIPAVVFGHGGY